jgi:hypothetical protein
MAHFAELDENNIVTQVLVVDNKTVDDLPFPESESIGAAFLTGLFPGTTWVQTSYNATFRVRYAGVGYTFISNAGSYGVFMNPQPYPSWSWNTETFHWDPPTALPADGKAYRWDEDKTSWVPVVPSANPVTVIG